MPRSTITLVGAGTVTDAAEKVVPAVKEAA